MVAKNVGSFEQSPLTKTSEVRLQLHPLRVGKNMMTEIEVPYGASIQGIVVENGAEHTCTRAGCSHRRGQIYVAIVETAVQSKDTCRYTFLTLFAGDTFDTLQDGVVPGDKWGFGVDQPLGFFQFGGRFGAVYFRKSPGQR